MNTKLKIGAAAALAVAVALGYTLGRIDRAPEGAMEDAAATGEGDARERDALYWYDPMFPDQRFDKPGKSPFMDMMLVPKYADGAAGAGVRIDPGVRQNLGVRTATVEVGVLAREIRAPGTLQWDLRAEQRVSARVEAIVERLHVRAPYERVEAGQALATLLAPGWSAALAEYRALAAADSAEARTLRQAARTRLRVLGLGDADLSAAGSGDGVPRIVLRAPIAGVLGELSVREGETVMAGQPLFRLNAVDTLWLEAALPQAEAGGVVPGTAVELDVSTWPGETFRGEVETLLPDLDMPTRTQTARIVVANPDGRLAAGMYAEAVLRPDDGRRCPLVPSEALILTGRDARVIVADAEGRFQPVRVKTGRQVGGRTEILEGLKGGEQVVVSGQFLIDSEASLSGVLARLTPQPEQRPRGDGEEMEDMEGMNHGDGESDRPMPERRDEEDRP